MHVNYIHITIWHQLDALERHSTNTYEQYRLTLMMQSRCKKRTYPANRCYTLFFFFFRLVEAKEASVKRYANRENDQRYKC